MEWRSAPPCWRVTRAVGNSKNLYFVTVIQIGVLWKPTLAVNRGSMRKEQHTKKLAAEKRSEWISHALSKSALVSGLAGILVSLMGVFLSLYVSTSESPKPDILPVTNSLLYFVGGIILLGVVTVGVASFMRRKNRDVILLKRRLAEIYLLALRKSALNPHPNLTSND
jgi:hypothetical protein